MNDMEKVIKGLECCLIFDEDWFYHCDECPYRATEDERKVIDWCCHLEELRKDALELLKEQEPVEPQYEMICGDKVAFCGNCDTYLGSVKYCPTCGRPVKWDA